MPQPSFRFVIAWLTLLTLLLAEPAGFATRSAGATVELV